VAIFTQRVQVGRDVWSAALEVIAFAPGAGHQILAQATNPQRERALDWLGGMRMFGN
jgi:hypothetical protein